MSVYTINDDANIDDLIRNMFISFFIASNVSFGN